jgi:hypothetical protein
MKKISTLYIKNPNDLSKVINELDPQNKWVIDGDGIPTRKFDGTATCIIDGVLYKRYDVKKRRKIPLNAIPCQEPDMITGHHPHWVKCNRNDNVDKWHFMGFDKLCEDVSPEFIDGTYELCGEKIKNNPEKIQGNILIPHGDEILTDCTDFSFEGLKKYLSNKDLDIEGIVFHHKNDNRMCKIRKRDFGIIR